MDNINCPLEIKTIYTERALTNLIGKIENHSILSIEEQEFLYNQYKFDERSVEVEENYYNRYEVIYKINNRYWLGFYTQYENDEIKFESTSLKEVEKKTRLIEYWEIK